MTRIVINQGAFKSKQPPRSNKLTYEDVAKIVHEVNRVYCVSIGDDTQVPWDEAPLWQQQSVVAGVRAIALDPDQQASGSHDSWLAHKEADGWVWGLVKSEELKEHPCMVPYEELPAEQKLKDHLFTATAKAALSL